MSRYVNILKESFYFSQEFVTVWIYYFCIQKYRMWFYTKAYYLPETINFRSQNLEELSLNYGLLSFFEILHMCST